MDTMEITLFYKYQVYYIHFEPVYRARSLYKLYRKIRKNWSHSYVIVVSSRWPIRRLPEIHNVTW